MADKMLENFEKFLNEAQEKSKTDINKDFFEELRQTTRFETNAEMFGRWKELINYKKENKK